MGLGLELVDPDFNSRQQRQQQTQQENQQQTQQETQQPPAQSSLSQSNAQLYAYYEDLIKEYTGDQPSINDKLALALILSRGERPTISKNRELALLDIDKMVSFQHNTLR